MGRRDPRFLVVGHISRAHGMKGELLVSPLTDHPEGTYAPGVVLRLGEPESDQPDPDLPPVRVESVRPHRGGYLVALAGVDHRSQSERLRGHYLFREASELEDRKSVV
jgi:16S rRNA processing protein RimM